MSAIALVLLVSFCLGVVALPRKYALICMMLGTLYLTQGAVVLIAGFNFQPTRILSYLCFVRVISKGEFSAVRIGKIDRIFVVLYAYTTLVLLTREEESPPLRLAKMAEVLAGYFSFRALIRTPDEWCSFLKTFALVLIPFVLILAVESQMRRNLFDYVGGLHKLWTRGNDIRCFGSFRHPSLMGSVGACFFPLFIGLARDRSTRARAVLGAGLCVLIVLFSNSGGPLSVLMAAMIAWGLWPIRTNMQAFRRGLVALLVLLAMVMKAPIWYLLARMSAVTGGTGWHRSYLIDMAVRNLEHWWLIGLPVRETARWMPYVVAATGGADITNQFIAFGLQGGILAVAIFIFLLYLAFSNLGRALAFVRVSRQLSGLEPILWSLGVALTAHIMNWLGITYFDQFNMMWFLHLAALASLCEFCLRSPAPLRRAQTQWASPKGAPVPGVIG